MFWEVSLAQSYGLEIVVCSYDLYNQAQYKYQIFVILDMKQPSKLFKPSYSKNILYMY